MFMGNAIDCDLYFEIDAAKGVASAPALRQLPAGDTFSDVTESMCLDAEAQTLAAATLSAGCAAQVCHNLPSSGPCFAAYSMCTLLRILFALHWLWECCSPGKHRSRWLLSKESHAWPGHGTLTATAG